ncbi:MAG: hypothetical protein ACXWCX_12525, partial [Burkholderiales bacterium]
MQIPPLRGTPAAQLAPATMLNPPPAARRALPSVDRLLNQNDVADLVTRYGRSLVVETIRALLD